MGQAAAAEGIPIEVLKAAKRSGCPMFKDSRIHSLGLKAWIAHHADAIALQGTGSLKDQKTAEEVRKLKLQNDETEGILIARAKVCETHSRILGRLLPRLEQLLTNEYPPMVVGLDVVQLRIKGRQVYDSIAEAFRSGGDLFKGF